MITLFPAITASLIKIEVDEGWVDDVKAWCLLTGQYREHSNLISTYEEESQPHQIDWMWEVLEKIGYWKEHFTNSWVQVYQTAGFQPPHNHSGGGVTLSGCLYLTEGPSSYFTDPYRQKTNFRNCQVGDVIMWDPELFHFSPPVETERVVMPFNLSV
jgi:hypothetical protein